MGSHYKHKTVWRRSPRYNGNPYIRKDGLYFGTGSKFPSKCKGCAFWVISLDCTRKTPRRLHNLAFRLQTDNTFRGNIIWQIETIFGTKLWQDFCCVVSITKATRSRGNQTIIAVPGNQWYCAELAGYLMIIVPHYPKPGLVTHALRHNILCWDVEWIQVNMLVGCCGLTSIVHPNPFQWRYMCVMGY